ncbi:unnamed protein product [marine sediment metagenome]|uniref:Lcl C-terminal domain-containing protein n=1 Tax=marine sediment metagenome TaxID=412755 RepID=X0ZUT8_9ZZZZ
MKTGVIIPSRQLPKTGQTPSIIGFDDGHYYAGWWKGLTYLKNKERFIAKTLTEDDHDVVIDNATGLMWAGDGNKEGCNNGATITWNNAMIAIAALNAADGFAGFKDWRMPNYIELFSLLVLDPALVIAVKPLIYEPPFDNTKRSPYLTSTAHVETTTNAYLIPFTNAAGIGGSKAAMPAYLRLVRGGV